MEVVHSVYHNSDSGGPIPITWAEVDAGNGLLNASIGIT